MESAGAGVWDEATKGWGLKGEDLWGPQEMVVAGQAGKEGSRQVFCSRAGDETGGLGQGKDKEGRRLAGSLPGFLSAWPVV